MAAVGQLHQRGRQVLVVGDHFDGQAFVGERNFEQTRFAPGPFAHGAGLGAPDVDHVAQSGVDQRRDFLFRGRAVAGRRDDAQVDQPRR